MVFLAKDNLLVTNDIKVMLRYLFRRTQCAVVCHPYRCNEMEWWIVFSLKGCLEVYLCMHLFACMWCMFVCASDMGIGVCVSVSIFADLWMLF